MAGRPSVLPQPPGPARAARWSRPASSTCTSPTSPTTTRTSTCAGTATPIVLHDPDGLIVLEEEDVGAALAAAVDQVRQRRVTDEWLVNRAIARGHVAEALRRLPALRARHRWSACSGSEHCPWRHDFGLRYLREDLPPDVADQIEELVPGTASATLEELSLRCFAWLDELLAR